jgi:predicted enzyme related to lactoylglutathione lyase
MAKKAARKKSAPKAKAKAKARSKSKTPNSKKARSAARRPSRRTLEVAASAIIAEERAPGPPRLTGPSVVHWEVQARDPAAQMRFFGSLFGWNVDANNPQNYGLVNPAGPGSIGGGIGATTDDAPRAVFYVQVPSIVDTLDKAATMGAQMVMPRTDIGMIVMAQFRDPEGNVIGLVEG